MNDLMPHQIAGGSWLASRTRGYLGDTPGSGKTRTLVQAALDAGSRYPMVVCPAIVRTMWRRELLAAGLPASRVLSYDEITAGGNERMKALLSDILDPGPDLLILDEAHYLKHGSSKRTRQILGRDGYARRLPRVWCASGTPIPKHPGEMWTIASSLFPALVLEHGLKTREDWMKRFTIRIHRSVNGIHTEKVVGNANVAELQGLLDQMLLRRDPIGDKIWWQTITLDFGSVPVLIPSDVATFTEEQYLRIAVEAGDLASLASEPSMARMRRRLGELKVEPVVEMLRSQLADSDEKIVVMFHHRSVGEALAKGLASFGVAYIDGDVSQNLRNSRLDGFQHHPACRVFLGQQTACGTGLDGLQHVASRMILVEPSWSAYENYQAAKRLDRMGQPKASVRVQMIALAGTLDEAIVRQNARETKNVGEVLAKAVATSAL